MKTKRTHVMAGLFGLALSLAAAQASAQTAASGRDLWWNAAAVTARPQLPACAVCHTNVATGLPLKTGRTATDITNAITLNAGGMRDIYGLVGAILSTTDLMSLQLYLAAPASVPSARARISPAVLSYASTQVGVDSAAMSATISHDVGSAIPFTLTAANAVTVSGVNAADFRVSGGTCTNGLAVQTTNSCTIQVTFRPTAVGASRAATLNIGFAETHVPAISIPLVGISVAAPTPTIALSANPLAMANTVVATSSAAQTVTLTNAGALQLGITSLTAGGANPTEFARSGTCVAGGNVAANGGTCTLVYAFTPAAVGARSATLTIASNNSSGDVTLVVNGTGAINTPTFSSTPAALTFNTALGATSAAQNVTVRNDSGGTLSVASAVSSVNVFAATVPATCSALSINQTCTIGVTFTPAALGAASATLTINHNAGAAGTVTLTGSGVSVVPVVAVAPATVAFANLTALGQQSAATRVRFTNSGPGPVTLMSAGSGAEFPMSTTGIAAPCTAGLAVASAAFCEVDVRFAPTAAGPRTGTLTFASNGSPTSATVALSGTGSATAAPIVGYTPEGGPLFAPTPAGTSAPQPIRVTVTNRGTANMMFPATNVATISTGFNPGDFRVVTTTCAASAPLQPNTGNCTVDVMFTPPAAGPAMRSAILMVNHSGGGAQIPVSGVVEGATGAPPAAPPPSSGSAAPAAPSTVAAGGDGGGGALNWQWLLPLLLIFPARRRIEAKGNGAERD